MSASSSKQTQIRDDDVYANGDCTIVSTDEVRFRVPSYYLLAASEVIRSMHEIGSGSMVLDMTDPDIESADSIQLWLDYATGKPPLPIDDTLLPKATKIMRLARKYDCASIERFIIALVRRALTGCPDLQAPDFMIFAATFGQSDMVADVIRERPYANLAPWNWALSQWRLLPTDHAWAITRSHSAAAGPDRAGTFLSLIHDPALVARVANEDEILLPDVGIV